MKAITILATTYISLLLSSCSTVTRKDCQKDMFNFGLTQGKSGLSNLSEEIRKVCIKGESTVDLEAYDKGFNRGWSEYCTPFHGFENGSRGDIYKSFCPPDKEEIYREKFFIGKKVYEKKDQVKEVEDKIESLKGSAEHDLSAKEELKQTKDYWLELNREIQSLEQKGRSPTHTN